MINLIIKSKEEIFNDIAEVYLKQLTSNPNTTLGLATGSSPESLYVKLEQMYTSGQVSFKDVKTYNLDEYCNLDKNDKNSYYTFMNEHFFSKVDIKEENTHFPPTDVSMLEAYEKELEQNPVDIQLLGIGSNGHIAFNEPGSSFDSVVRIVDLDAKTIEDNSRFFNSIEEVPTKAASMGLKDIMRAKKIVLVALGQGKAQVLKEIFADDKISESIPATLLKTHPDVTFYVDEEAGKFLK